MFIGEPEDSVTRPANTTQYTAGDVVSDAAGSQFVFTEINQYNSHSGNAGSGALIQSAVCISSANQSTKPDLELLLFDSEPSPSSGAFEDNAAFDPTDASLNDLIGIISFAQADWVAGNTASGASGNSACQATNVGQAVLSDTLYGVLVERGTYTPVSAEVFTIRLFVVR